MNRLKKLKRCADEFDKGIKARGEKTEAERSCHYD